MNLEYPGKPSSEGKRNFVIDFGVEKVKLEGQDPEKTLVRYLMKKRKILLFTRNPAKAEEMFGKMPTHADVTSLRIRKSYDIKWEKVGTGEFRGARFAFKLEETQ